MSVVSRIVSMAASVNRYDPVVEFGADLRGWWDASDLASITKDGSNGVTNWNSRVNGIGGVAENESGALVLPLWEANGRNGRASVKFTRQGYFTLDASITPQGSLPATMVAVGYLEVGENSGTFLSQGEGPNNNRYINLGGGNPTYRLGQVLTLGSAPAWAGNDRIVIGQNGNSAAAAQINVDGQAAATATPSGAIDINNPRRRIGANSQVGAGQLEGKVQELLTIDRQITTLERQKLEGYLAWKWGLVGHLPNNHPYRNRPPR